MYIQKETHKGFVNLLTSSACINVYGDYVPSSHTLCVAEYGKGCNHYKISDKDLIEVIMELNRK